MGVVEQAGKAIVRDAVKTRRREVMTYKNHFELDIDRLKDNGCYYGADNMRQLAQQLRAVKRRLLRRIGFQRSTAERNGFNKPTRQRNLVLVTSTRSGEGKTFNAANLALSFAMEDQIETLAVDCDLIRPQLRNTLGAPEGAGLSEFFTDPDVSIEDVAWRAKDIPLSIIGAGAGAPRTAELLGGETARSLWAQLSRENSDRLVILDAPPVLAATDAVVLARYVDEIVFVIEANKTPEPAAAAAIDELLEVNPNVSIILNKCLVASGGSHYGSYEYYDAAKTHGEK